MQRSHLFLSLQNFLQNKISQTDVIKVLIINYLKQVIFKKFSQVPFILSKTPEISAFATY